MLSLVSFALGRVDHEVISPGQPGVFPQNGQTVRVHYTGTLVSDGTKFDSSRDRGEQFTFQLGQGSVIPCWDQGVAEMTIGERAILTCSSDTAYGAAGAGGVIPPNADLKFDVELFGADRAF